MNKLRRTERITLITRELMDFPNRSFPLTYFCDKLQAAKSSISEDLSIIKETFHRTGTGLLKTQVGATGGVCFVPMLAKSEKDQFIQELCRKLSTADRVVPGGFIYLTDIIFDPVMGQNIGRIFSSLFAHTRPDFILTIETKGIPLALLTAREMGVPLIIVRDESKVSEGSAVSINYVSGSTKRIQTMALARRALPAGSRVLIIDDFMKGGGTAKGMLDLMTEFGAQVTGIGVLISTTEPETKLVDKYVSLLELVSFNEDTRQIIIRPGNCLQQG
ncbi:MAG TPA: pur operon repressor [Bacillota bacterium]|nr:pur operon repressor [Bacillota bacterium]